jgi:hypothetical protein
MSTELASLRTKAVRIDSIQEELDQARNELDSVRTQLGALKNMVGDLSDGITVPFGSISVFVKVTDKTLIHCNPNYPHNNDYFKFNLLRGALTKQRKGFDRLFGYLFGKPNRDERQVEVRTAPIQDRDKFEAYERLEERDKVRTLRRIARANRSGGNSVEAHLALDKFKKRMTSS